MMATKILDLKIRQGETFQRRARWEMPPYIYKPITAITQAGPVRLTVATHGLTDGWRAAVVSVQGMHEINARYNPPRDTELKQVTVVDANTVEINAINSAEFSAYTSGGYLQFWSPVDLTGYTARMQIKDRVGGTLLFELTTANGRIVIDAANRTITLLVTAADTALMTWKRGTYDLEMVGATGIVSKIFRGEVCVEPEVTT